MNTLIVGASGNLGSHFVKSLLNSPHRLRLLIHNQYLPFSIEHHVDVSAYHADLEDPSSLVGACKEIDSIVYLAGALFRPRPESFLYKTNTLYVKNLVDA